MDYHQTRQFKKDKKLAIRQGKDIEKLIEMLLNKIPIPKKNKDHQLIGNWAGFRCCHIEPDRVLTLLY